MIVVARTTRARKARRAKAALRPAASPWGLNVSMLPPRTAGRPRPLRDGEKLTVQDVGTALMVLASQPRSVHQVTPPSIDLANMRAPEPDESKKTA